MASEEVAVPLLAALLRETFPPVEPVPGPGASKGKGKKRKRGAPAALPAHHELFPPTPLSELVVDGMSAEQLWEQLELRGAKIERLIGAVVQTEGGEQEGEDEEDEDEDMPKGRPFRAGAEDGSDEDEFDSDEEQDEQKLVHSIAELSDAEMRALGLDPAMRDEYMSMADEDDSDGSDAESEEHGYPGTSDLSDEEDAAEISFEPLLSEKEQQARKAAAEAAELGRLRSETRQRRMRMGKDPDAEDSDEESDEGIDPELAAMMDPSYGEDDEEEDEDEEAGSGSESEEDPEVAEHRRRASILDNLDEPGSSVAGSSRKG